jgi:hypothetical protein
LGGVTLFVPGERIKLNSRTVDGPAQPLRFRRNQIGLKRRPQLHAMAHQRGKGSAKRSRVDRRPASRESGWPVLDPADDLGRRQLRRDIDQGELIYGIEVSPTLISNVTEAIMEEVKAWQSRPLEEVYPIVYLDAMMVKMRDNGHVQNQAIYVVLGVDGEGQKEVLGLWAAQQEGAKFWLQVLTELKNRGVKVIFIACVDGLKGFPEAIEALYPQTEVQLCTFQSACCLDLASGPTGQQRRTANRLPFQSCTVAFLWGQISSIRKTHPQESGTDATSWRHERRASPLRSLTWR